MRVRRTIRIALLIAAPLVLGGAVAGYLLLSRVPSSYQPLRLDPQAKDAATSGFYKSILKFNEEGQKNAPFTWSVSQEWINRSLASMDEIARKNPFGPPVKPGTIRKMMDRAGLADPAVTLDDGKVTIMVRSARYNKVVSADVGFQFTPDGGLRVLLEGMRIGAMPVPSWMVAKELARLKADLARRLGSKAGRAGPAGRTLGDSEEVIGRVIAAIDGEPIVPELEWKLSTKKRVRIDAIDIADGELTVHAVPIDR